MMKLIIKGLLVALIAFSAFAGVNLKNGNFYVSYTDIIVPGTGAPLDVTRTFNSKSNYMTVNGFTPFFGDSWSSFPETFLYPSADGSIYVHEYGGGDQTRFVRVKPYDFKKGIDLIVESAKKKVTMTETAIAQLKKELENSDTRHMYSLRYKIQSEVPVGEAFTTSTRGNQKLERLKDMYKRTTADGREDYFNLQGRLLKVKYVGGHVVDYQYDKNNKLQWIKDNFAKQIYFSFYPDGKVKEMWSAGDKKSTYTYNDDTLTSSKDVGGNVYSYKYDKNHNMVQIAYSDKSTMEMTYHPKDLFITSVTDRNKDKIEYEYGSNPSNPSGNYWTVVRKKGYDGKQIENKYEYDVKSRADGSKYTHRIIASVNGNKTETVYSECCGLPVKITQGKNSTSFEYTAKGLLLKKNSTSGEFVNIDYYPTEKIKTVTNNDGSTAFEYDKTGNLTKAVSSAGKAVVLLYDSNNRITKMLDHDKKTKKSKTLAFQYNSLNKPVVIEVEKMGKINVSYDNYGQVKEVKSERGPAMAAQVTESFQNLLTIVKPAGVDLNM